MEENHDMWKSLENEARSRVGTNTSWQETKINFMFYMDVLYASHGVCREALETSILEWLKTHNDCIIIHKIVVKCRVMDSVISVIGAYFSTT